MDVIVPIDFSRNPLSLLIRTKKMLSENWKSANFIFGVNDRGSKVIRFLFEKVVSGRGTICDCRYLGKVNRSKLRNSALAFSNSEFVMLCDVDIDLTKEVLEKVKKEVADKGFSMVPCLYRRKGINEQDISKIVTLGIGALRRRYSHLAIPSSIIAFRKTNLRFDENYLGHGYEDFDFMINLLQANNLIAIENWKDEAYDVALMVSGFRKELALLCLKNLEDGIIVEHEFHDKGDKSEYLLDRERNRKYFFAKFRIDFEQQKNEDEYIVERRDIKGYLRLLLI